MNIETKLRRLKLLLQYLDGNVNVSGNINVSELEKDLTFFERLQYKIHKNIKFVDVEKKKGKLEYYLFKCSDHGVQVNYLSSHYLKLQCPECLKEES